MGQQYIFFNVLLTVHLSITLVNDQLTYLITPWSRVLPEKLTSKLCH